MSSGTTSVSPTNVLATSPAPWLPIVKSPTLGTRAPSPTTVPYTTAEDKVCLKTAHKRCTGTAERPLKVTPARTKILPEGYATSTDPAIRNPAAALEYDHKAVTAGKDHPNPIYLDTLVEAYYVNWQFEDAVKTERLALASAPSESKSDFVKSLEKFEYARKENNYRQDQD